jgi:hypothetical protein
MIPSLTLHIVMKYDTAYRKACVRVPHAQDFIFSMCSVHVVRPVFLFWK